MNEKIHWADAYASQVARDRKHCIATGITPSGPIHIGNMREVLTGDLVYRAVLDRGLEAELLYIADDFDPLRKVYPFLPESFAKYVGHPISDIPCPCGCCRNYAEHFLNPFLEAIRELDIRPRVIRASEEYRKGSYTDKIGIAIGHAREIRSILERISGRTLPPEWSPFYPICGICGRISNARILRHEPERHLVHYRCDCGNEGVADYSRGEGKLVWRVDWPMRWAHFGVTIEPFGKDHASAGGSWDTGKEIARRVFCTEPPFPVIYEWISLKGKGTMHSSKGIAITINEMLEILPPDVLRYLIVRTKPEKAIDFDPGIGLISLFDEFDRLAAEGRSREFELSRISSVPTRVPFRHMITVVQIARDDKGVLQCLARSGYDVKNYENILAQARRVRIWLKKYAPEFVKFSVKEELPLQASELGEEERRALREFMVQVQQLKSWNANELHDTVYAVAEQLGMNAAKIFSAIYIIFLGQKQGPRMGWFLEAMGKDTVVRRLKEAMKGDR